MPALHDDVLDAALNIIKNNTEKLYILKADPGITWSNIATHGLGSKASPTITGPADHTSGRKITIGAITDGTVSATDVATYFALTDDLATKILASGPLSASQGVTNGNIFTLTEFIVAIPDPA